MSIAQPEKSLWVVSAKTVQPAALPVLDPFPLVPLAMVSFITFSAPLVSQTVELIAIPMAEFALAVTLHAKTVMEELLTSVPHVPLAI